MLISCEALAISEMSVKCMLFAMGTRCWQNAGVSSISSSATLSIFDFSFTELIVDASLTRVAPSMVSSSEV